MKTNLKIVLALAFTALIAFSCGEPEEEGSVLEMLDVKLLQRADNEGKEPKYVVAVFEEKKSAEKDSAKDIDLSASISEMLNKSGRVILAARDEEAIEGVMAEVELSMAGLTANSAQVGEMLGADIIVVGKIINATEQTTDKTVYKIIKSQVQVMIKGINAQTGQEVFSITEIGLSDGTKVFASSSGEIVSGDVDYNNMYVQAAARAVEKSAHKIVTKFPLIGYVIDAGEEKIMTDLGADYSVNIGNKIGVIRKGEPVRHPRTGEVISYKSTLLAEGSIEKVQKSSSTVVLEGKPEMPIQVGDIVILNDFAMQGE